MNLSELIETYLFQGRKDLIMKPVCKNSISTIIESYTDETFWNRISANHPFYYYIPYLIITHNFSDTHN